LRGKTTIRESAAILSNSMVFVGLVGFLMHLARAVECRSVIVYGGREAPWQSGYSSNENLYTPMHCSPCWLWNRCDYDRECMNLISVEDVTAATERQVARAGQPLVVDSDDLDEEVQPVGAFRLAARP
jgi:ADP-heptose:LPS heptosyltransferase